MTTKTATILTQEDSEVLLGKPNNSCAMIAAQESWRLWCRLCAKEDPQGNISIFLKDEQAAAISGVFGGNSVSSDCNNILETSLAAAIEKYFWVNMNDTDDLPKMLCTECYSLLTSLVNFSERVTKVQEMLIAIQNATQMNDYDLHALRLKFGLLDEDREHVLCAPQRAQPVPEVHYFEDKPKLSDASQEEEEVQEEKCFEIETTATTTPTIAVSAQTSTNPLEQKTTKVKVKTEQNFITKDVNKKSECDIEKTVNDDEKDKEDNVETIDEVYEDNGNGLEHESEEDEEYVPPNKILKGTCGNASLDKQFVDEKDEEDDKPLISLRNISKTSSAENLNNTNTIPKKRGRPFKKLKTSIELELNLSPDNCTKIVKSAKRISAESFAEIYCCTDCPRKFKRAHHYRQHMKQAHAKDVPPLPELQCTQCPRMFNSRYNLDRHMRVHLPLQLKKVLPCVYCDKKFSSNPLVQTHIKNVHMNERPFICEECGAAVRTNASLKQHMLTHTDYAPFECEICKKGFKNQLRLKNHMETHDPEKHICAECGLQLNSRATLNRHLLVHSDVWTHKCDYCGRAFKRAKALKNHLILHTGLKPYSCDFCDRTFANGSNCRSHKKKAHPRELAELEAAGGGKSYTRNIPKLEALKAVTKAADNLAPVVSKHSGNFAFGKKPPNHCIAVNNEKEKSKPVKVAAAHKSTKQNAMTTDGMTATQLAAASMSFNDSHANTITNSSILLPTDTINHNMSTAIPTIDNIYSHIIKHTMQDTLKGVNAVTDSMVQLHSPSNIPTMLIKRPPSQASSTCAAIEQDDVPILLEQQPKIENQDEFYSQIIKQTQLTQHTSLTVITNQQTLLMQQQQDQQIKRDDVSCSSAHSPDSQCSHLVEDRSNVSVAANEFYQQVRQQLQQGPPSYL